MYRAVYQKSITVPGVKRIVQISRVSSDRVWISDFGDLILTDTSGHKLDQLIDIGSDWGVHTVNSNSELIFIDRKLNINKLSNENKVKTIFIKYKKAPWKPRSVYSLFSTGDLLVGMRNTETLPYIGKLVRYNSTGENTQTIQHDNIGQEMYSDPMFIIENRNGDIIVSDWWRVVVTDRGGRHRFSYTGPPSGSPLWPRGICTDALSHILVCDDNTESVQVLDRHGNFLTEVQTQQHGIDRSWGLNYDNKTRQLWIGSATNNIVNIYRVVHESSLTDTLVSTDGVPSWSQLPPVPPPLTQKRPQLESTYQVAAPTTHVTSTEHSIKFRREIDDLPSGSSQTFSVSRYPSPRKIPRHEQKRKIKETTKEFKVDIADFPSGSTENVSDYTVFLPPKKIIKTEVDLKFQQEETKKEFQVDADLPSGSTEIVPDDIFFIPPKDIVTTEYDLKCLQGGEPMYFPTRKLLPTESDLKFREEYRPHLSFLGRRTPVKKSTSRNQVDTLEREIFRSELEGVLCRIQYVDCNGICGRSVKHCSIGKIKTCSEFSTQGIFGWTKSCSEKIKEAQAQKCKCFVSTYCVLITIKTRDVLAHVKVNELQFVVKHLMDFAIESSNFILLSELVRLYAFHCDFQLETLLMNISKKINTVIVDTILLSAKCMILRKYPSLLQNSIQLSLCYDCEKGKRVTVVLLYKGTIEMMDITQEKVIGKTLFLYNCTNPSDEAYSVFKSYATSHSEETLPIMPEKEARELFKRHSNLTMISASPYKSIGYSKGKHRIVEKPCILFLCLHKGYIPFGEEEFLRKIGDVEVDVQEGVCYFGNGESKIEMGGDIRRKGSKSVGSIGGFVNLGGNKTGLITCAHVVLSHKELEKREINHLPEVETFINSSHSYKVCGKVINAEFPKPDDCKLNPLEGSSVDAALIELASSSIGAGFLTVTEEQFRSAGFQTDKPPKFHGKIVPLLNLPNMVSDSVVKYGATTGLTLGCLFNESMHVRINSDNLTLSDILGSSHPRNITVYNQMEIEGIRGQFFDLGDSGSFVFCINQDETLSCIGMAIGYTSRGTCLVTPIENVLKSLQLDLKSNCINPVEIRLSPGIKTSTETEILNAITQMKSNFDKFDKRLLEQQKQMQKHMLKQQKDIQDIKKNLTKFSSSNNQSGT